MPTSPSESLLLFTPWNQLNFDVTGFNNTQDSRDNRSCHYHAQLECSILCRCIEPALVSSCTRQTFVSVLSRVSGHFTHCWAYRPVFREMNSLIVKVSILVHFQPDSHVCFQKRRKQPPTVFLAAGPRSIKPTTTHRGHRPENSLHHVNKKFSRVSAFNPAHLSGKTQDANYVSFQLQFITHSQLRHTSFR